MNLWTEPQPEHSTSFLKIQEVSSHSLGQDEMFCHIMQWLFIASIWQCFTAYKQNNGKRAYMQKFFNRTCANKKPRQKNYCGVSDFCTVTITVTMYTVQSLEGLEWHS